MSLTEFESCRTVAETNQVFKDLFLKLKAKHDNSVADQLRDAHRIAMTSIIYEIQAVEKRERADADLYLTGVKNWCLQQGLITVNERINKSHKDAWRAAHPDASGDPREAPVAASNVTKPDDGPLPSPQVIRLWAALQGMTVGKRGRLHPDVIAAYRAAHQ